jgi:hypothetical protein
VDEGTRRHGSKQIPERHRCKCSLICFEKNSVWLWMGVRVYVSVNGMLVWGWGVLDMSYMLKCSCMYRRDQTLREVLEIWIQGVIMMNKCER